MTAERRGAVQANFGEMFIQSKGAPIDYNGKTLIMLDRVPVRLGERLLVTIESTRAEWPQGVGISEGLEVFGERVERVVVWEYFSIPADQRTTTRSRLPFSFEVTCRNEKGTLSFYNVTEFMGRQEWWHGGAAMVATDIPGGRRYSCNDFEMDDDFDDLLFTVTRLVDTGHQCRDIVASES
jgi:hypothetical protein